MDRHERTAESSDDRRVLEGRGHQPPRLRGFDEAPEDLGCLPGGLAGWGAARGCHCSIVVGEEGGAMEPRTVVDSLEGDMASGIVVG